MMKAGVLDISDLTVLTPERTVLEEISMTVEPGKIVSVLGPNGAGKSELVLAIAGQMAIAEGSVSIGGTSLADKRPEKIRALGVAAVPEGHQVLSKLTVHDNLQAAGSMHSRKELADAVEGAYAVFPEIRRLENQRAGMLSGGQQQMVALAQAMVCQPKILLVDEMSLGLAPIIIERLMNVLVILRERGIGILLIEQFTHLALGISDYSYVLNRGRIVFSGYPKELNENPGILHEAYLTV